MFIHSFVFVSCGLGFYDSGCDYEDENKDGFTEAVDIASRSDIVIMSIGEVCRRLILMLYCKSF
jgi:hypothetical protein